MKRTKNTAGARQEPGTSLAYGITETSLRLGVGRTIIYQLLRDGKLRAVKIGDRTVIPDTELQNFLSRAPAYQSKGDAA